MAGSTTLETGIAPWLYGRAGLHRSADRGLLVGSLIIGALHLTIVLLGLIVRTLILIVAIIVVALELLRLLSGVLCRTVLKILRPRIPRTGVAASLLRPLLALLFLHLTTSILRHDCNIPYFY